MPLFLAQHFDTVLAILILIGRLGDIVSTYLVSPTLALEANPIVRRLGWRFAIATIVVAGIPYFDVSAGVMVAVPPARFG
jgi:hypothetical protein